jgi:hypothetical protein
VAKRLRRQLMDQRARRILIAWIASDLIWAALFVHALKRAQR